MTLAPRVPHRCPRSCPGTHLFSGVVQQGFGSGHVCGLHLDEPVLGRVELGVSGTLGVSGARRVRLWAAVAGVLIGVLEVQVLLRPVGPQDIALGVVRGGRLRRGSPTAKAQVVPKPLGHLGACHPKPGCCKRGTHMPCSGSLLGGEAWRRERRRGGGRGQGCPSVVLIMGKLKRAERGRERRKKREEEAHLGPVLQGPQGKGRPASP